MAKQVQKYAVQDHKSIKLENIHVVNVVDVLIPSILNSISAVSA